ncbi:hypothetical protein IV203_022949 [Nitzschia inconspicua]|uniref:Uncharacterized protein n=1 Tax=Nitzschia inconspicua TaxID=303405 RepID=A0A9K3KDK9_9STRA|nr:hypothetical protein IV203_022949 [Nitzschia inconspicua]
MSPTARPSKNNNQQQQRQSRFFTTTSKQDNPEKNNDPSSSSSSSSNNNNNDNITHPNTNHGSDTTNTTSSNNSSSIQELVDTTVKSVRPIVESAEVNLKKAADVVRLQDLGTLYGIVLLVFLVVTTPFVARRMRGSDGNNEPDVNPEDPVMDLVKMFREEFLAKQFGGEDGNNTASAAMGLDRIVADLLKSTQVQDAVSDLVAYVIASSQFKTACNVLVKELLKDLLDDPDTLKQVVHVLQHAIVDDKIKEAAIQLVTEVFGDDRVLDELVTLVQRLGMEQQVQLATQALLVESAHNALNDPEILDHSMEFATDVVGDDVVQQTAGEALYNTLSYAIRPTLSVLLTFLGIGLIALSVSAFRSANADPGEPADQAFFKTLEELTTRLFKLLCLPYDFVVACKDAMMSILLFPFQLFSKTFTKTRDAVQTLVDYIHTWFLWLFNLPGDFFATMYARFMDLSNHIGSQLWDTFETVQRSVSQSVMVVFCQKTIQKFSDVAYRTKIRWIVLNKQVSNMAIAVEESGTRCIGAIRHAVDNSLPAWKEHWHTANQTVTNGWTTTQVWTRNVHGRIHRGYHTANRSLARWSITIETFFVNIATNIRSFTSQKK